MFYLLEALAALFYEVFQMVLYWNFLFPGNNLLYNISINSNKILARTYLSSELLIL